MVYEKKLFNYLNIMKAPDDKYGIYSIWSKSICIYVGQARNQSFRERLQQHYNGSHNEKLQAWIQSSHELWYTLESVENPTSIDAKERNRIKRLSPITNKQLRKKESQYGHKLTSL